MRHCIRERNEIRKSSAGSFFHPLLRITVAIEHNALMLGHILLDQIVHRQVEVLGLFQYIGRFLELCSTLIRHGEERAKHLNRLARDRKLEELYANLKSTAAVNEGVRIFHQNFDTAFLNIYPNFISEVNKLMLPDNEFEVAEDSTKLTTELRVLALIRLGITDNQKIADILRSSITTIYTYRSKIKGRAQQKESFEDDIKRIATY